MLPQSNNYNSSQCGKAMVAAEKTAKPTEFKITGNSSCPDRRSGRLKKERNVMKNNQINIPQAREAMDKFKMQAAQEVGVNLTNGYNGHLTSREAGSVGGQMVKKMIESYEQNMQ